MLIVEAENKSPNCCFLGQSGKRGGAQRSLFQPLKRFYESRGCPNYGGRYVNVFRIDVPDSCRESP